MIEWIDELFEQMKQSTVIAVAASKVDLKDKRVLSLEVICLSNWWLNR